MLSDDKRSAQQGRLAEVAREIERLIDLAARVDGVAEIAVRLEAQKQERERITATLQAAEAEIDVEALRPAVEERLDDLRATLAASPEHARRALRALLPEERLRVGPDSDRGFRVTGTAWLTVPIQESTARPQGEDGRCFRLVAGGRYARVCRLPGPLALPVVGSVADAA